MKPVASVITTVAARTKYLREALLSVQAQTFTDFEVIVSDDGNSPDVRAIVRRLADPRFIYRGNSQPLGMLSNKIAASESVRGRYVAVLDDDDLWSPDFLARLVPILDANPHVSIAFSDHYLIDEVGVIDFVRTDANTRRWGRHGLAPGVHQPFIKLGLVDQAVCTVQAALLRVTTIDWSQIPPDVEPLYDQWLTYMCSRNDAAAYYVPERLTYYRSHDAQFSYARRVAMSRASVACWGLLCADPTLSAVSPLLRRKLASAQVSLGFAYLHEGERRGAFQAFIAAWPTAVGVRHLLGLIAAILLPPRAITHLMHLRRLARGRVPRPPRATVSDGSAVGTGSK